MQTRRPTPRRPVSASAQRPRSASVRPASGRAPAYRSGSYPPPRSGRGKKPSSRVRMVLAFIALLLIAGIIFVIDTVTVLGVNDNCFYNVTVNGVNLNGYTQQAGIELMHSLESDWSSRVYTLTYGGHSFPFAPSMIRAELDMDTTLSLAWNYGHVGNIFQRKSQVRSIQKDPAVFISNITYDEALLNQFIASIQAVTDKEPVDALVVLGETAPMIHTNSQDGSRLDVEKLMTMLETLMLSGEGSTALPVDVLKPTIESSDLTGTLEIIATCETNTSSSSKNRVNNIAVGLGRFNAITLEPGAQISFNDVVGPRTKARGFKEAPEYSEGETVEGIGGGICQASSTLYGAVLRAGMTIVRRSPHSMTVGYVKPSLDAAVTDTSSKDLVFRNDSDHPIYIYTRVDSQKARVIIYGSKPEYRYELESFVVQDKIEPTRESTRTDDTGRYATYTDERVLVTEGKTGRISEAYRVSYDWDTGEEVSREKLSTDTYEAGVNIYYVGVQERLTVTDQLMAYPTLGPAATGAAGTNGF